MKRAIFFFRHTTMGAYPTALDIEFLPNPDPHFTVEFKRDFSCADEVLKAAREATQLLLSGELKPGTMLV